MDVLKYVKGAASGQGSSSSAADTIQQIVDAATRGAVGEASPGFASCINDAMKNLSENPGLLEVGVHLYYFDV